MFVGTCISQTEAQQAANPITAGDQLPVPGKWVAADHSKLSEHNIEWMQTQPPQVQAEFLLSAAINHDKGATDWINKLVEGWHGKLRRTQKWEDLQDTALYSNDLRVRAAAIDTQPDRRDQEYRQAQAMLVSDAPVAFLAQTVSWSLVRPYVKGVTPTSIDEWAGALFPTQIYIAPK